VSIRFASPVPEFIRGAWIREVTVRNLTVEGVDGPFFRNWSSAQPQLRFEGISPEVKTVLPGEGKFKVKSI